GGTAPLTVETRKEQQVTIMANEAAWPAAGIADRGRVRSANEDFFVMRPEAGAFVVCDGMGGAAAGETASHLAAETAVAALVKAKRGAAAIRVAVRLAKNDVPERA